MMSLRILQYSLPLAAASVKTGVLRSDRVQTKEGVWELHTVRNRGNTPFVIISNFYLCFFLFLWGAAIRALSVLARCAKQLQCSCINTFRSITFPPM
jgi:hypothetical protein